MLAKNLSSWSLLPNINLKKNVPILAPNRRSFELRNLKKALIVKCP